MSSNDEENKNNNINNKSPKPQIHTIVKKPSFICLSQVDEDSGSGSSQQEHSSTSKKLSKSNEGQNLLNEDLNVSNDRYEDSFDEEFGNECETKPASNDVQAKNTDKKDIEN